ncbi:MAG: zinc ribbon domain-containing protein [Candidatus Bathyarchaeota archaeon]|nr:zinc ribbon domain-containing protein [Candidatus Bathyarchaeota archaeon]
MSEYEVILRQEAGVKDHQSESPPTVGLKAGAFADLGTLILTNKRLIYIAKGGASRAAAWAIGGVFAAQAIEQRVSKAEIDELATQQGSYYMPLQNITRVEAGKKMGQSYVRVDSTGTEKPVHAYVVAGGNNNQQWVAAINQAKTAINASPTQAVSATQQAQRTCQRCGTPDSSGSKFCTTCGSPLTQTQTQPQMPLPPPPPPPPTQTPTCPYCRNPIRYIQQYQRWYCDNERRYV